MAAYFDCKFSPQITNCLGKLNGRGVETIYIVYYCSVNLGNRGTNKIGNTVQRNNHFYIFAKVENEVTVGE